MVITYCISIDMTNQKKFCVNSRGRMVFTCCIRKTSVVTEGGGEVHVWSLPTV